MVGLILILILEIALGWNYFKLLLETVERYIVVGALCYTSPLAFSMGSSKTTNTVFRSWCRMVGSQLLLLVMNVWFLRGFASSIDDIQKDALDTFDLRLALQQAKDSAQGVTAKGIHCLELTAQGYSSQEIAAIVHAEAATVRMWMTKARRYLRSIPELRQYAYSEVAG